MVFGIEIIEASK